MERVQVPRLRRKVAGRPGPGAGVGRGGGLDASVLSAGPWRPALPHPREHHHMLSSLQVGPAGKTLGP